MKSFIPAQTHPFPFLRFSLFIIGSPSDQCWFEDSRRSVLALGRKFLEELLHGLVDLLGVFFRLVAHRVRGRPPPEKLFSLGTPEIDDQGALGMGVDSRGGCSSHTCAAPTSTPTATVAEAVGHVLFIFLAGGVIGHVHVGVRFDLANSLGGELGLNAGNDALIDLPPRTSPPSKLDLGPLTCPGKLYQA